MTEGYLRGCRHPTGKWDWIVVNPSMQRTSHSVVHVWKAIYILIVSEHREDLTVLLNNNLERLNHIRWDHSLIRLLPCFNLWPQFNTVHPTVALCCCHLLRCGLSPSYWAFKPSILALFHPPTSATPGELLMRWGETDWKVGQLPGRFGRTFSSAWD